MAMWKRRKSREKRDEIRAFEALKEYAASFPNGTIEQEILDDEEDEDDDGVGVREVAMIDRP